MPLLLVTIRKNVTVIATTRTGRSVGGRDGMGGLVVREGERGIFRSAFAWCDSRPDPIQRAPRRLICMGLRGGEGRNEPAVPGCDGGRGGESGKATALAISWVRWMVSNVEPLCVRLASVTANAHGRMRCYLVRRRREPCMSLNPMRGSEARQQTSPI